MAKITLLTNCKFKKLVLLLGLPRARVLGYLEMLWICSWAEDKETYNSREEIEVTAEWDGEPGVFAEAMVLVGLLDATDGEGISIHDYAEHAPDFIKKRHKRRTTADNGGQREPVADNGRLGKDSIDKDSKEKRKKGSCPEPQAASSPEADPVFLDMICVGKPPTYQLKENKVAEWEALYGEQIDVRQVLRVANQWNTDNVTKQKTARGATKFFGGWLEREVNKGGRSAYTKSGRTSKDLSEPGTDPFANGGGTVK